jgi:hypothetical protein
MKATSVQDAFEKVCAMEAPLHERLAAFSQAVREFGLPYAEAYDDLVARIRSGEAGSTAPEPGEPMPEFLLPDSSGRLVSLGDVIAEGRAVVSFNRGHWCEYCGIELTAFRQALNQIAAHGAKVVSIMPESEVFTGKAAADVGNAFQVNGARHLARRARAHALPVAWAQSRALSELAQLVRADSGDVRRRPRRLIIARHVDPDFRNRMDIEEIVTALKGHS